MNATDFLEGVKAYLRMPLNVSVYDEELKGLINAALSTVEIAGYSGSVSPILKEFVNCYVRRRMLSDITVSSTQGSSFQESESAREMILIQQLIYGG